MYIYVYILTLKFTSNTKYFCLPSIFGTFVYVCMSVIVFIMSLMSTLDTLGTFVYYTKIITSFYYVFELWHEGWLNDAFVILQVDLIPHLRWQKALVDGPQKLLLLLLLAPGFLSIYYVFELSLTNYSHLKAMSYNFYMLTKLIVITDIQTYRQAENIDEEWFRTYGQKNQQPFNISRDYVSKIHLTY